MNLPTGRFKSISMQNLLSRDRKLTLEEKIGWLFDSFATDDTCQMIADMDRTNFEDEFLLPNVALLDAKLSTVNTEANPAGVLSRFFSRVEVLGSIDRDNENQEPQIAYAGSGGRSHFLLLQAWKERKERHGKSEKPAYERRDIWKIDAVRLRDEFGGKIKIHHTNNEKLRRVGASDVAATIRNEISELREHLEAKQGKRKRGLGALMRKRYLKG